VASLRKERASRIEGRKRGGGDGTKSPALPVRKRRNMVAVRIYCGHAPGEKDSARLLYSRKKPKKKPKRRCFLPRRKRGDETVLC